MKLFVTGKGCPRSKDIKAAAGPDINSDPLASACYKIINGDFDLVSYNFSQVKYGIIDFKANVTGYNNGRKVTLVVDFMFNPVVGLVSSFPKNAQFAEAGLVALVDAVSRAQKKLLAVDFD